MIQAPRNSLIVRIQSQKAEGGLQVTFLVFNSRDSYKFDYEIDAEIWTRQLMYTK